MKKSGKIIAGMRRNIPFEEVMQLSLPDEAYIFTIELKAFFTHLAELHSKNNLHEVAKWLNTFQEGWFYNADKLIEDSPGIERFIGDFFVKGKIPESYINEISGIEFESEDGKKAELERIIN